MSTRRARLRRARLRAIRPIVLAEQHYRCFACGKHRMLDLHHLVKRSLGGTDERENLVGLCRACHDRTDLPASKGRLMLPPRIEKDRSHP